MTFLFLRRSASAVTEASDWAARSVGPDVIYAQPFASAAEVNAFRWINGFGNDPNSTQAGSLAVTWDNTQGFSVGGCLKLIRGVGTSEPASWWRPNSPLLAGGNGLATDDPGAGGAITRRTWNPSNASQNGQWDFGYYGPADVRTDSTWDGGTIFHQFRFKPIGRWANGLDSYDGKIAFVATTGLTPTQEILIQARGDRRARIYTGFGSPGPLEFMFNPQDYDTGNPPSNLTFQPGGAYDATCRINTANESNCWYWHDNEWTTVLVELQPGHGVPNGWGSTDTVFRMWIAREGQTSYTKIYDKSDYQVYYTAAKPLGYNALQLSVYTNGANLPASFTYLFRQVIASRTTIACPQV